MRGIVGLCCVLVCLGTVAGCSSDAGGGGGAYAGGGGGGGTISNSVQANDAIVEVTCNRLVACTDPMSGSFALLSFATVPACKQFFLESNSGSARLDKAVADGLVVFDAAKANTCLQEITTYLNGLPCNDIFTDNGTEPDVTSCKETYTGTLEVGATCPVDEACKSGFCNKGGDNKGPCDGVCAAKAAEGASCYDNDGCTEGLNCSGGKCVKYAASGSVAEGAACHASKECKAGTICASGASGKTCTAGKAEGAECSAFDPVGCALGLVCDGDKCAQPKKAAESCTPGFLPILPSDCGPGLVCAGEKGKETCVAQQPLGADCTVDAGCRGIDSVCKDGKCAAVAVASVGGACVPKSKHKLGIISFGCPTELVCDPNTSLCAAAPAAGASCVEGDCGTALRCNSEDKCVAFAKDGEDCEKSSDCADGLTCASKKCVGLCK